MVQSGDMEDDWIAAALLDSAAMVDFPASADNTVVGFTESTLLGVQEIEELMNHDDPVGASRAFEVVVSNRVTPRTDSHEPVEDEDIEDIFATLRANIGQ